ncbi:gamma-mobile-trio protein GmtX [Pseudomonas hunanensis]|uniref:gamma-mobile-trio protein GmtX n=1 Tax=Pseudomonas hunanensis TaxID=1247546 RepID=UPI0030D8173C
MKPDELLVQLKATSRPRTHKTLDAIYMACVEQRDRGSTDFSYAMISRVGKPYGVPAVQSLHNSGGANYRALIDSFAPKVAKKTPKATGPYSWIEELPAGETKLLVKMLLADLKSAQRTIKEVLPNSKVFEIDLRQQPSSQFKLLPIERRALEYLCSDSFFNKRSLSRGPRGDVNGPNGEQLFRPGTMDAIDKALKHL